MFVKVLMTAPDHHKTLPVSPEDGAVRRMTAPFASIDGLITSNRSAGTSVDGLVAPQSPCEDGSNWRHDPMDLDYDSELAAWIGSWGLPVEDAMMPATANTAIGGLGSGLDEPIVPDDLLFPDDELALRPNHGARDIPLRGPSPSAHPSLQKLDPLASRVDKVPASYELGELFAIARAY